MRKLTVMRRRAFSACFIKMNVYAEDALFGDTLISGVKCRKLGELRNGEVKEYVIDEGKKRIFILSESVPFERWNESYTVPAGSEDVRLSGKNNCNPFEGNLFRFDGNDTDEVLYRRKRGSLIWWGACGITAVVGFILALIIVLTVT